MSLSVSSTPELQKFDENQLSVLLTKTALAY